jgi:hypothetical protein
MFFPKILFISDTGQVEVTISCQNGLVKVLELLALG